MSTPMAEVLWQSLPGVHRDQDADGQLQRFLELMAGPLAELDASIAQLYEDLFVAEAQPPLLPLIGALVGARVDPSLPARIQRDQVRFALHQHRTKGPREPLQGFAESLTGWRVEAVDFSQRVARTQAVESLRPVGRVRDGLVAIVHAPSGTLAFRADAAPAPLFDALGGRTITREALDDAPEAYAGAEDGFTLAERGADLFTGDTARRCVAADLSDPTAPRTPGGVPVTAGDGDVLVDPELGRFRLGPPAVLAGNLRASYHALAPAGVAVQTTAVGAAIDIARRGRSDDPLPYTLDLRAPARPTDRAGHHHYDNVGLFCTPARIMVNRRPTALPPGTSDGRLSFDDRPLALGDAAGIPLQLLDGVDGAPLTRLRLAGAVGDLAGAARGFAIRVGRTDVTEIDPPVRVVAADLTDFAAPLDPDGTALVLGARDVAVDPQLGRILVDLDELGTSAEALRVDYLLAPAEAVPDALAHPAAGDSDLRTLDPAGAAVTLVDAIDGTPIASALRLGAPVSRFHGTSRGWIVRRNGTDTSSALAALVLDLADPAASVPAGRIGVDPEHGWVRFPAGVLAAGDRVTVTHARTDPAQDTAVFERLAQHLPDAVPAGVVPVIADTRVHRTAAPMP